MNDFQVTHYFADDVEDYCTKQQRLADDEMAYQASVQYEQESKMNELEQKISELLDDKQAWTEDEDGTWMRHNSGLILNVSEKQFLRVVRPASVTLSEETKDALWPKVEAIIGTLDERRAKRNALNTEKVLDALASHFEVKELVATGQAPF